MLETSSVARLTSGSRRRRASRRLYRTPSRSCEPVGSRDVLAQNSAAPGLRHRRDHPAQLFQIRAGMIGMRVVARPEELVLADVRHQRGDRALVRVRRDEALPLEVVRRLLLQPHGRAERRPGEGRVGAVEEVTDPAGLGLEDDHAQAREALEDAELEEGGERLLQGLTDEGIEVPDRPAELVEAMVDVE